VGEASIVCHDLPPCLVSVVPDLCPLIFSLGSPVEAMTAAALPECAAGGGQGLLIRSSPIRLPDDDRVPNPEGVILPSTLPIDHGPDTVLTARAASSRKGLAATAWVEAQRFSGTTTPGRHLRRCVDGIRGRGPRLWQLAVVQPGEKRQRRDRTDQREEHVPLGVPDIALGGEEVVGR